MTAPDRQMAKVRAFSGRELLLAAATWLATGFQRAASLKAAYKCATSARSFGLSAPLAPPTSFTSVYSLAYLALLSAGGGSERN